MSAVSSLTTSARVATGAALLPASLKSNGAAGSADLWWTRTDPLRGLPDSYGGYDRYDRLRALAPALRVGSRSVELARLIFAAIHEAREIERSGQSSDRVAMAKAYALARTSASLCRSHGVRISASGPIPSGPAVLVANHVSYLDPLAITALVPCLPIAKREVGTWPFLGRAIRSLGVSMVDRGAPMSGAMSLRRALRLLRAGVSVLNFPEGTTTDGDEVLPFRRGIFGVARLAQVPVVPVAIRFEDRRLAWTGEESFLPHYLRTIRRSVHRVHVRFGPPLTPFRYSKAGDLATEAGVIVAHMLWER